jgi:hypothetical protein
MYVLFNASVVLQSRVLTEFTSIAIWNRNNVAVAMAIGIWIMNAVFFIQGRSLRHGPVRARALKSTLTRLVTDLVRVNIQTPVIF